MKLPNGTGSISKIKGKRRKPWRVRVTTGWQVDPDTLRNKQIIKDIGCYATRQEAMKALMDYNDNPYDLDLRNVTFEECYEGAKKDFTEGRKHNYYAAWKYLAPIKDKPIRSLKAYHMQQCIDSCKTTQQQEIKTVCHKIYDYALRYEIVDKNPSQFLKSISVHTKIDREVFTNDVIATIPDDIWWGKITLMLLYTGMRTKELLDLSPDNIDTENNIIDIQKAKNISSLRKIPIHERIRPLLCDYKEFGCNLYGYTHDGLNKALKASYKHTAHDCRHTFVTRLRECGCDPLVVELLVGHTPKTITERVYTHVTMKELRENINKLNYDAEQDTKPSE